MASMYVSITGLKVKSFWSYFRFLKFAVLAKTQADKAPGILHVSVRRINGVEHTLTAWVSKDAMRSYVMSGEHLKAVKSFRKIAVGKTFGFETDRLPDWSEVHQLWLDRAKEY